MPKITIDPIEFHAAVAAVNMADVPVVHNCARHAMRKERAKLTRELFRKLGLRGISVTSPNYSMAHTVDIVLPSRKDWQENSMGGALDWLNDPVCIANRECKRKVEEIIQKAFPNCVDRSDLVQGYYDYCWSVE